MTFVDAEYVSPRRVAPRRRNVLGWTLVIVLATVVGCGGRYIQPSDPDVRAAARRTLPKHEARVEATRSALGVPGLVEIGQVRWSGCMDAPASDGRWGPFDRRCAYTEGLFLGGDGSRPISEVLHTAEDRLVQNGWHLTKYDVAREIDRHLVERDARTLPVRFYRDNAVVFDRRQGTESGFLTLHMTSSPRRVRYPYAVAPNQLPPDDPLYDSKTVAGSLGDVIAATQGWLADFREGWVVVAQMDTDFDLQ